MKGLFFSRHGDDLRPKCHPFLLGHASHMLDEIGFEKAVKCFWSSLDSMASQFAIEKHRFCCAWKESHPVGCEATDLHMSSLHRAGCFALALGRCHLPQGCWPGGLSVTVMEGHPISLYFFETSCGIAGHFRRAQNSGKIIFRHIIRPWSLSIEP